MPLALYASVIFQIGCHTFYPRPAWDHILLISSSQITGIIGMSYHAWPCFLLIS
jgi:hypothetical protein